MNQALETASVHTVILSNREILNLKSFDNLKFGYKLRHLFSKNLTAEDNATVFQNTMRETLKKLLNANKRVIYIQDIPELGFNPAPATCENRPWRIGNQMLKTPCATKRNQIENHQEANISLIYKVLNEFPQVIVWETAPAFCDVDYCWAIKDKKMLYRDDNHLNETGAIYLKNYLNEKYPILKN